jgi:predicted RNA binding protein YcfA (HicA-like mRNA interferase family)
MKFKDLIRELEDHGFYLARQSGHIIYSNGVISVAVPRHKFVNGKTVHFILKNAGIK